MTSPISSSSSTPSTSPESSPDSSRSGTPSPTSPRRSSSPCTLPPFGHQKYNITPISIKPKRIPNVDIPPLNLGHSPMFIPSDKFMRDSMDSVRKHMKGRKVDETKLPPDWKQMDEGDIKTARWEKLDTILNLLERLHIKQEAQDQKLDRIDWQTKTFRAKLWYWIVLGCTKVVCVVKRMFLWWK